MRHESKFAAWIRSSGNSVSVLPMGPVQAPEVKFSLVSDRLLDSIIDDALAAGVARLNGFLPEGVRIDITSVDLTTIRDQLRTSVADRLNETGVPVNPNDPVINAILARYAEALNGYFQRDALQLATYVWRSQDSARGQRWENVRRLSESEVFANVCRFSVSRPRVEDAEWEPPFVSSLLSCLWASSVGPLDKRSLMALR